MIALIWGIVHSGTAQIQRSMVITGTDVEDVISSVRSMCDDFTACDVYQVDTARNTVTRTKYGWVTLEFSRTGPTGTQRAECVKNYIAEVYSAINKAAFFSEILQESECQPTQQQPW